MATPIFQQIMTLAEQLTAEERIRLIQELQQAKTETEEEEDSRLLDETLAPFMQADGSINFDALEAESLSGEALQRAMPDFVNEHGEIRPEMDWKQAE